MQQLSEICDLTPLTGDHPTLMELIRFRRRERPPPADRHQLHVNATAPCMSCTCMHSSLRLYFSGCIIHRYGCIIHRYGCITHRFALSLTNSVLINGNVVYPQLSEKHEVTKSTAKYKVTGPGNRTVAIRIVLFTSWQEISQQVIAVMNISTSILFQLHRKLSHSPCVNGARGQIE